MTEPMFSHSTPNDTYEGDTQLEMYRQMVERGGLTGQDIANIFGVTRASVSAIFKRMTPEEKAEMREQKSYWARIKQAAEGDEPFEEIAKRFDGPEDRTVRHLKRFRKVDNKKTSIKRRQQYLIKSLFDVDMQPGPKFVDYIEDKIPLVERKHQIKLLRDYYIEGESTDRFKRGTARRKLAGILQREGVPVRTMVEEGILEVLDDS